MAKKGRKIKQKGLVKGAKVGDLIEISWMDVMMQDKITVVEMMKPPFDFDKTTNYGRLIYNGPDWVIIGSELPHNPHAPGATVVAFPKGIMSTATVKIIQKHAKINKRMKQEDDQ